MNILKSLRLWLPLCVTLILGCGAGNGEIRIVNDPFAGPQRGFALYLDPGHFAAVGMSEGQGKFALEVLVVQRGVSDHVGKVGDKGEFKVGDEILTFETAVEARPVSNATRYEIFTQWRLLFKLTPEQAVRFAKAPFTAVKVHVGDQWFQLPLNQDQAKKFQGNLVIMTQGAVAKAAP